MSKYLKLFETTSQYNEYINSIDVVLPNVSVAKDAPTTVYFNPLHDYSKDYLTFVALEDGTFTFSMVQKLTTAAVPSMSYSTDNGKTWTTVQNIDNEAVTVTTPTITSGNKVLWKSNAVQYCINPDPYPGGNMAYGSFSSTSAYNIEGNIMSLMYGDDFKGKTSFKTPISSGNQAGAFSNLFNNNSNIISVEHLVLPATTLADKCYYYMFEYCTNLTTAPELPATTLTTQCYYGMFKDCQSLTTAPELPATTLANQCYYYMFTHCTSLTSAPVLPATTLADSCYNGMFQYCTNLTTAPELPSTTLANYCYSNMFYDCKSLTTAPVLPATTLTTQCYFAMFKGCTSLTTAPELPATTLQSSCYNSMFQGCTSLTTAPELLPATTLADSCYKYMFNGCTNLTTAPVLPATTLASECYASMFYGCTKLNYIKAMFTTTPSTSYTSNWVNGVAATGTFVKNSAATWNVTGIHGIPSGWTITTASA